MRFAPRHRRAATIAIALILVLSFLGALSQLAPRAKAQTLTFGLGSWTEYIDYGAAVGSSGIGGTQIYGNSCVDYQSDVYCVGGESYNTATIISNVYYADVLPSGGLTSWTETTDYGAITGDSGRGGTGVEWPSCVESSGYIYCIGGSTPASAYSSKVFYAQLNPNGVGPWTETTDYGATSGSTGSGGIGVFQASCVADGGFVYCVGGTNVGTSKVFYAQLTPNGVGPWTETTNYGAASGSSGTGGLAVSGTACTDDLGYILCVGGDVEFTPSSDVFYAPLNGGAGVGPWTETTDYGATTGYSGTGGVDVFGTS